MELPEIYVECKYLPNIDQRIVYTDNGEYFNKVYEIDGFVFKEEPFIDQDDLLEFEIHAIEDNVTLNDAGNRPYVLQFSTQKTCGIIINSNILVPENNYHTIISDQYKCVVCDTPVELPEDHIKLDSHKYNLEKCEPLKEYDDVIRKINEKYYCAVCNVIIEETVVDEHFASADHEDKTLFAIKRATDVLFGNDYRDISIDSDIDANTIEVCDASDETTRVVDERDATSNVTNDDVKNVSDRSSKDLSYAAVVKKFGTVNYKDIILNGQAVRVTLDSWHMILTTKKNEFYCMVCVGFHDISEKAEHCSDETHLDNLSNCETIERYTDHFVRKLNDRYDHCGTCNKLILINDIDDHINIVHLKKFIPIENNTTPNLNIECQGVTNVAWEGSNVTCEMNQNLNQMQINHNEMILSCYYIFVNQFNYTLRVSLISYNMVYKRPNDYYCFKCDCVLPEIGMSCHIYKQAHIDRLAFTPFEPYFGVNLIRLVNQNAHCTICNLMFDVHLINLHINDKLHNILLNQAIRIPYDRIATIQPHVMPNRTDIESISTNNSKMEHRETNVIEAQEKTNDLKIESYNSDFVYLKYKNTCAKVTFNAYHSVLSIGDGSSYCFVCSKIVFGLLKDHIESPDHVNSMSKFKFIDKYEKHLLRQNRTTYHCCNCNVIVSKSELPTHMSWQPLRETKVDKKTRRIDLKSGIKQIDIELTKESHLTTEDESKIEILFWIDIKRNRNTDLKKTNKIIVYKGKAVKVSWDVWHSLYKKKDCYRCLMCQKDVKHYELSNHITNEKHGNAIQNTFARKYLPDLLRKVDDEMLNCLTCNMLVSSKDHIISKHISGKKHINANSNLQIDCDKIPDSKEDIFKL